MSSYKGNCLFLSLNFLILLLNFKILYLIIAVSLNKLYFENHHIVFHSLTQIALVAITGMRDLHSIDSLWKNRLQNYTL